ncbi:MAG: SMP-30/gluconolactonase/LRE family protein [Planctomycetota bacterium]|jgi:DNA-binding beta-propeller fold protein YncE
MRLGGVLACGSLLVICGCAAEIAQEPEIVWPAPPEKPRIKYLRTLTGESDFKRSSAALTALAGEERGRLTLMKPYGVCVDKDGRVYVSDTRRGKVLMWDFDKSEVNLVGDEAGPGGLLKALNVAVSDIGSLYVTDGKRRCVNVYDREGNYLLSIGGPDVLERPTGLAVDDARKRLYVVDTAAHNLKMFSLTGKLLKTIGKRGIGDVEFNFPTNVATDSAGKVYVADTINFRVQILTPGGELARKFGSNGTGYGQFSKLKGVSVDSEGHIYASDAAFSNVQIFDQLGRLLLFFGTLGTDLGKFQLPAGVFVDHRDRVYVVDQLNRRVQVFQYLGKKYEEEQQGR